ncbi:MAG: DNA gyrase inhibitor YacG [Gammaproteobacteria bacterium]|nr:DNA gyrase inhibitor YacG [Gammaproteobacteria bacterium]
MSSNHPKGPRVHCPVCHKAFTWDTKRLSRPFCSERCRLIDLGEWLDEGYAVADKSTATPYLPSEE